MSYVIRNILYRIGDRVPSVRASLYFHSIFGQARRSFRRSISFLPVETVSNMVGGLPSSTMVGISNQSLDVVHHAYSEVIGLPRYGAREYLVECI